MAVAGMLCYVSRCQKACHGTESQAAAELRFVGWPQLPLAVSTTPTYSCNHRHCLFGPAHGHWPVEVTSRAQLLALPEKQHHSSSTLMCITMCASLQEAIIICSAYDAVSGSDKACYMPGLGSDTSVICKQLQCGMSRHVA
jgi:hypothetical protein